jgi:hypothetical protein
MVWQPNCYWSGTALAGTLVGLVTAAANAAAAAMLLPDRWI